MNQNAFQLRGSPPCGWVVTNVFEIESQHFDNLTKQMDILALLFCESISACFALSHFNASLLFEIASVPVRLDHVASRIVNADHSIV
jgi:hypothetical protein